ncbi:MAG: cytochrome ubiquinol oxidase subunit I, partial [Enterovibrio sp.]
LEKLRAGERTTENIEKFSVLKQDLGYGLLLKAQTDKVVDATEAQIKQAAKDTIPQVAPLFWSFRIMVGCGVAMLALFGMAFYQTYKQKICEKPWLLKASLWAMPLPWIAVEAGWFIAEYGRQPWAVGEILPVNIAASNLTANDILMTIGLVVTLYTLFLIVEVYLMLKFARLGPSSLKTGRYHFEQAQSLPHQPANA